MPPFNALRSPLERLEDRAVPALIGALDPTFAGLTGATIDTPAGVVTQRDGKVVVAGTTNGDFVIARFNPDGSPDATFIGALGGIKTGMTIVDIGGANMADKAFGLALDAMDRIVVVGSAVIPGAVGSTTDFALVRLSASGAVEMTKTFHVGEASGPSIARSVAIQPDGTIVVAGDALGNGTGRDIAFARVDPNTGELIGAAQTISSSDGDDTTGVMILLGDGSFQIAGTTGTSGDSAIVVLKRQPNGDSDPSFGSGDGFVEFDPTTGNDIARGAAITPDGGIVLIMSVLSETRVFKLLPDGTFDPAFNDGMPKTIAISANGVAIQQNGTIVIMGTDGVDSKIILLNSTGPASVQVTSYQVPPGHGESIAIDNNGRILIAGTDAGGDGILTRVFGTIEKSTTLSVGGGPGGNVTTFTPDPDGALGRTFEIIPFSFKVRTASGDVNGDGTDDVIAVSGPGTPIRVTVISGVDNKTVLVPSFDPFGGDFMGGGYVAAADLNGDGHDEFLVTPDEGGGPRVSIFSLLANGMVQTRANFFGIDDPNFRGGARAAFGDVNGDGVPDVIVGAGFGGGPRVALFDGSTVLGNPMKLVGDFFAFPGSDATNLRNGVFVGAGDVDGDGDADLIFGGGPGGAPRVFILSGAMVMAGNAAGAQAAPIANFFVAGNSTDRGGIRVAVSDVDGDGRADVSVGSGENAPAMVRVYLGSNFTGAGEPGTFQDINVFGGATLTDGVYVG